MDRSFRKGRKTHDALRVSSLPKTTQLLPAVSNSLTSSSFATKPLDGHTLRPARHGHAPKNMFDVELMTSHQVVLDSKLIGTIICVKDIKAELRKGGFRILGNDVLWYDGITYESYDVLPYLQWRNHHLRIHAP